MPTLAREFFAYMVARKSWAPRWRRWFAEPLLLLISLVFSLFICEMTLSVLGRYDDVANPTYSADLIWERPKSTTLFRAHPDLGFPIPSKFDRSGVRNDGPTETENKKNIYAFFGDSYTENRRVQSELSFTEILGDLLPGVSVVNYGVDGYGLDQEYLRYKKFSHHDIKRVFYVFCENDFRNLYETHLVELTEDNKLVFLKPRRNWAIDLVAKFRITYLIIEVYHKLIGLAYEINRNLHDAYASPQRYDEYARSMVQALVSKSYDENSQLAALRKEFRVLLQQWNNELNRKGISFDIIVLPWELDDLAAKSLFGGLPLNVLYLRDFMYNNDKEYRFKNDGHWNEKGNLFAAITIYKYLGYDLRVDDPIVKKIRSRIEDLYAGRFTG
jgi:hypothetical protein